MALSPRAPLATAGPGTADVADAATTLPAEPPRVAAQPATPMATPRAAPAGALPTRVLAHRAARSVAAPPITRATRHAVPPAPPRAVVPPAAAAPAATSRPSPARTATRPPAGSDDYPYAADTSNGNDPWGFTKRQCVSYAGWRLARAGRPLDNTTQHWGDASSWAVAAARLGRQVDQTPSVGSIAQWNAGEGSAYYANGSTTPNGRFTAGPAGHVAWVSRVYADGSVQVEQYNLFGSRSYSTARVQAPRYLHLG